MNVYKQRMGVAVLVTGFIGFVMYLDRDLVCPLSIVWLIALAIIFSE